MTVEIKELVIRAVVDPEAEPGTAGIEAGRDPVSIHVRSGDGRSDEIRSFDQAAVVASCVREVMRRLEKSRER